jgi:hypothetical protein
MMDLGPDFDDPDHKIYYEEEYVTRMAFEQRLEELKSL